MVYVDGHVRHSYSSTVTQKKACKIELEKRASNIFFKNGVCFSLSRGFQFQNFLARWPQPRWGLLRHHYIEVKLLLSWPLHFLLLAAAPVYFNSIVFLFSLALNEKKTIFTWKSFNLKLLMIHANAHNYIIV